MRETLIREPAGRGLVLLGASVQGWYGPAPQPQDMAYLLRLCHRAQHARRTDVPPAQRHAAWDRVTACRERLELHRDAAPVPWAEAAWVCVLARPNLGTPLALALAVYRRGARRTIGPGTPRTILATG